MHPAAAATHSTHAVARRCGGIALLASTLLLLLSSLLPASVSAAINKTACTPPPIVTGDYINVALLVWLADQPHGLFTGNISQTTATAVPGYGRDTIQPYYLGLETYVNLMRANGPMPLANGQSVELRFHYINLAGIGAQLKTYYAMAVAAGVTPPYDFREWGEVNYTNVVPGFNFPYFAFGTMSPQIPGSAAFPGKASSFFPGGPGTIPPGFFHTITSQDPAVLQAHFGITRPFTFIVPPVLTVTDASAALFNLAEDAQSAIFLNPFASTVEEFVCDGVIGNKSFSPDCTSAKYGRGRLEGARRFETLFSVWPDTSGAQQSALEVLKTLGAKSMVMIADAPNRDAGVSGTFAVNCAKSTREAAGLLNVQMLDVIQTVQVDCLGLTGTPPANCPPPAVRFYQSQVWPNGMSGMDMARHIAGLNPDALLILGIPTSGAAWTLSQLIADLKTLGWTPKAMSFAGRIETALRQFTPEADLQWSFSTLNWDPRLKGPMYRTRRTATNFELLPSDAARDAPQVFQDYYDELWGPAVDAQGALIKPAHPMWVPSRSSGAIAHAFGFGTLTFLQKIVERAQTLDIPAMLAAAKSMSVPSMYHQANLDVYGRLSLRPQMLKQTTPQGQLLIYPYNVADAVALYPLPTWEERVFDPRWYSTPNERVMVALNSLSIAACLGMLVFVALRRGEPVIKAASPAFCLMVIWGCVLMLCSNYFHTLVTNDAHCAAQAWLLSLGFTLTYGALFIKTARLWRIFGGKKLQVVKISDRELALGVGAFVAADTIINAVWAATVGITHKLVVTDVNRPQQWYLTCDYSESQGPIYTHLAIKLGTLLIGVALTWAVRQVPSQFNESTLIGLAIYNCSAVLVFVLPILSAGLGGRDSQYLIVNYAVMFVALSTVGLLYVPKMLIILGKSRRRGDNVTKVFGGAGGGTTLGTRGHAVGGYHPSQVDENGNPLHSSGGMGTPDLQSDGGHTILRSAIDGPYSPKGGQSALSPKAAANLASDTHVAPNGTARGGYGNGVAGGGGGGGRGARLTSTNRSKSPPPALPVHGNRATLTAGSMPVFTRRASSIEFGGGGGLASPSNAALLAPGGPDAAGSSRSPTPKHKPASSLLTVDPPPIAPGEGEGDGDGHIIVVHPHRSNIDDDDLRVMDEPPANDDVQAM